LISGGAWCGVSCEEGTPADKSGERPPSAHPWYFTWGAANVYPRLAESEAYINRDINGPLGVLFLNWKKPATFKDYRESGLLWEPYVGVAKELNRKMVVFLTAGAVRGTIMSSGSYRLLLMPTKVDVRFRRTTAYVTTGLSYYPWERCDVTVLQDRRFSLKRSLQQAKPFVSLGLTYMNEVGTGSAEVSLPLVGRVYAQSDRLAYDFAHLTTRLGVEIPLSTRNSISMSAGYAFCYPHGEEFSGPTVGIFHVYRF
jgi:hypothetical protein